MERAHNVPPEAQKMSRRAASRVMDVMSFQEGCRRGVPCFGVIILLWLFGGLFILYQMITLSEADVDARDLLADFRTTIPAIQESHRQITCVGYYNRTYNSIDEAREASYFLPVVILNSDSSCPQNVTESCLATTTPSRLLSGHAVEYSSCTDFAAIGYGTSSHGLLLRDQNGPELRALLGAPGTPLDEWTQSEWNRTACAHWETIQEMTCERDRDPCVEAWDIAVGITAGNATRTNLAYQNAQTAYFAKNPTPSNGTITASFKMFGTTLSSFEQLDSAATAAGGIHRAQQIRAISVNEEGNVEGGFHLDSDSNSYAELLNYYPVPTGGYSFLSPTVGLNAGILVNGERVLATQNVTVEHKKHKRFGWTEPFWVHKSPCKDTASSTTHFSGTLLIPFPYFDFGKSQNINIRADFPAQQLDDLSHVPLYKMEYADTVGYTTAVLSRLSTVRVNVAPFTDLHLYNNGAEFPLRPNAWKIHSVTGDYVQLWTGALSAGSSFLPAAFNATIVVEIHDAAEASQLSLPDFVSPPQMLFGIILGGLGFLATAGYLPWLLCTISKHARENNGLPPANYRSSYQYRGW